MISSTGMPTRCDAIRAATMTAQNVMPTASTAQGGIGPTAIRWYSMPIPVASVGWMNNFSSQPRIRIRKIQA